tara:strand:+ start:23 stop:160 length:138 start_codon:yes stop_codon:yes gene_type:complete
MSSKKAMKQAQKQNYARFKNNFSTNSRSPFSKSNSIKAKKIKNKK